MNVKKPDFDMSSIAKAEVRRSRRLVLDEKKIPRDAKLFQLAEQPRLVLVREDLGQRIVDEDCLGILFQEMEGFGSELRERG
ncbi:hypothetical protein JKA73_35795 [Myxococcus xanthus]|uniref:hypothetical protein n=1 Tax=Myxococcus xanthus TaxID=34 RepID=UPI001916EBF5|nr:hypothetical protein [Myxococcus xanthus]QQR44281.1 hypothetical protein JKA73_35795 [Myxococcus xanthus]